MSWPISTNKIRIESKMVPLIVTLTTEWLTASFTTIGIYSAWSANSSIVLCINQNLGISLVIGPVKGVFPTPDTDQIFYSTLGTEGKIWSTPTFQF